MADVNSPRQSQDVSVFRHLQQDYLREATLFYRKNNQPSLVADLGVGRDYQRLRKEQEYTLSLKRLQLELKDLTVDDFERSSILCACRLESPHYKLTAERKSYLPGSDKFIFICPISLAIQWTRLNLIANMKIEFDVLELLRISKL